MSPSIHSLIRLLEDHIEFLGEGGYDVNHYNFTISLNLNSSDGQLNTSKSVIEMIRQDYQRLYDNMFQLINHLNEYHITHPNLDIDVAISEVRSHILAAQRVSNQAISSIESNILNFKTNPFGSALNWLRLYMDGEFTELFEEVVHVREYFLDVRDGYV